MNASTTQLTPHQAKYIAHELTLQHSGGGIDRLGQALFNASVDLNPHQIEAAVFALRSPLSKGVLLADEVGLGKTIEAGIVLCQYWAERKRQLLVICPASLRKQWAQELEEKFNLPAVVLDSKTWREAQRRGLAPLRQKAVVIVSYAYATRMREEIRSMAWNLVVIDEAHKLRNAYRESNKIGQAIRWAAGDSRKLLLTATPLQNSILELYGLSTLIDENIFGDVNAFRSQFMGAGGDLQGLRNRLAGFCKRTLRKDVTEYINYTERRPHTQKFRSTDDEHKLYEAVTAYLLRDDSYAIPRRQRHLTELILRKLLASSSLAIAGTLSVMKLRLDALREEKIQGQDDWVESLIEDEEIEEDLLDEILNEGEEEQAEPTDPTKLDRKRLNEEIIELDRLIAWAQGIGTDTKSNALLQALAVGFNAMASTGAQRKALIFTESKRTQEYLKRFLEHNGHGGKVVLFSGTNNSPEATSIYERWVTANQGSGRITGSRDIDIRSALIECFRDEADILIATEAAAEGVNMQFCSLVINYDLPWNPQRVEQRIGRCHRYGQKHDVVVINFFNERNHADQRVLELLADKFNLFNGVFGASDEVLGTIESGVDFERRILEIYQTCRTPEQIDAAFNVLRAEMDASIQARMQDTRRQLLENFDADVHDRLRLQLQDTRAHLDRFSRRFWHLSRHVLRDQVWFDNERLHFDIKPPRPADLPAYVPTGRYHLISRHQPTDPNSLAVNDASLDGHTYRLSHPLGEWVVHTAKVADTPVQRLVFDTQMNEARITVVDQMRGQSGVLTLQKLTVDSFEKQEYLLFSAMTDQGKSLDQETCEKLMDVVAAAVPGDIKMPPAVAQRLQAEAKRHADATIAHALETNNQHFTEARDKLDRWAEDMELAAEQALKNTKEQIKVAQREARQATTLEEQQTLQERIAKLERQKRRQQQEIFDVSDEIRDKREALIDELTLSYDTEGQQRKSFHHCLVCELTFLFIRNVQPSPLLNLNRRRRKIMTKNNASNTAIQELGDSPDPVAQRKAELLALLAKTAPELMSDNQINVARLQEFLGEERVAADEHYELSWAGKSAARREIQKTSSHTLRPDANNPAHAQHMLIEGENLEVLRALQKSYYGKIKMIYIDPPYNTGSDSFVYPDNYSETLDEYQRRTGEKNEAGYLNKQSLWKKNSKESGQYHSVWLSMMYPRLYLARNLLRQDGMIFVSIDDNEAGNLKLLGDEIFGAENFVGSIVWQSRTSISDDHEISLNHNSILIFAKSLGDLKFYGEKLDASEYSNRDDDPRGPWKLVPLDANKPGGNTNYPITNPVTKIDYFPPEGRSWAINPDEYKKLFDDGRIAFGLTGDSAPKKKLFLLERLAKGETKTPSSVLIDAGTTKDGSAEIQEIFGKKKIFSYPKPVSLLRRLIQYGIYLEKDQIVFDFFAGSGTTAQAVMVLNAEDDGNRQSISVQMPEVLDEESEAYKSGYRTIADITRARIDKVISKLKAEHPDKTTGLACAHFTLAPSNFKVWQGDVPSSEALREQLSIFQSAEKSEQSKQADVQTAMLTELLLKHGLGALGVHAIAKPRQLAGVTVHRVLMGDDKTMWLCFETYVEALKDEIVKAMPAQVVMLNSCFVGAKADEQLANLQLELAGLDIGFTVI